MSIPRTATGRLLRLGIVVLTLGTAITHLSLNFPDPVFLGNGLGYLVLLALLYGPFHPLAPYRSTIRLVLIGYTLLTIVLWIVFGYRTVLGYTNKTNEVLLVVLLVIEARRAR